MRLGFAELFPNINTTGNSWENPYSTHDVVYTKGWEFDGAEGFMEYNGNLMEKSQPYFGKSMGTNFRDCPHRIGFAAFSHTMEN